MRGRCLGDGRLLERRQSTATRRDCAQPIEGSTGTEVDIRLVRSLSKRGKDWTQSIPLPVRAQDFYPKGGLRQPNAVFSSSVG